MAGASRSPVSVGRWWQVALLLSAIVAGGHARESYNILFIVVDDLKPTLGVYGDGVADTPNMDSLLNRGVRFENMNCQKPECAPSRASMISGKRNDALKLWDFSPVFRKNNLNLMVRCDCEDASLEYVRPTDGNHQTCSDLARPLAA